MTDDTATTTAAMAKAAAAFLAALTPRQRQAVRLPPDDPHRHTWTYLPGDRPGQPVEELTAEQRGLLDDLVRAGSGDDEVTLGAVRVERARRALVLGAVPDGDKYWVRIGGEPGDGPWSWRINGHHLAIHVEVFDDRYTVTPHFIGAEPARLPADAAGLGSGYRLLAPEEDLARALLAAMDPERRAVAVPGDVAPHDILTRFDPVADPTVLPSGIRRGDLDDARSATSSTGYCVATWIARRRTTPQRAGRRPVRRAWTRWSSPGSDRSSPATATTTACAARRCSSSTTTPKTTPTMRTRSGDT